MAGPGEVEKQVQSRQDRESGGKKNGRHSERADPLFRSRVWMRWFEELTNAHHHCAANKSDLHTVSNDVPERLQSSKIIDFDRTGGIQTGHIIGVGTVGADCSCDSDLKLRAAGRCLSFYGAPVMYTRRKL